MTPEREIREALAHIVSGPPDNGVSHRRALDALDELVFERDEWRRRALLGKQLAEAVEEIDEMLETTQ